MKIRNRITLWITGVGILASLLFSLVVFYEMVEQPYELLDSELDNQARTLLPVLVSLPESEALATVPTVSLYWLKIYNEDRRVIYESKLSRLIALPSYEKEAAYTVTAQIKNINKQTFNLDYDDSDNVEFRVRVLTIGVNNHLYKVQIAKSMGNLTEEISELLLDLFIGIFISAIFLICLGYYVAGRILEPLSSINTLSREITDQTIGKRIPLGKNKDELYELSASLNTMFDRLQYSFAKQKEFVASVSHELKTPITMLRIFFDEQTCKSNLSSSLRERMLSQQTTLARMDRLVKNLLDLSVLELKNTYEPTGYDLAKQVHSILDEFSEIFEIESINVIVDMPGSIPIFADKEKLQRVLINIIDNAIKYNKKNGEIKLIVSKNDTITLEVYNTGVGIPQDDLERVFDQFYRVEKSRSRTHGGSGLGLSIVKQIINLHGGSITIESKPGAWVQVGITLPIHA